MINVRPLQYFVCIVELGSVSRAALHVGVAQPALSQHIAALERDLRVKLLHRSPQGVRPTEAGLILYRQAQAILRQVEQARQSVQSSVEDTTGQVSIGLSVTTAEILSLPLLKKMQEQHPGVRLQIVALPRRLLGEMLLNGRLDIALVYDELPASNAVCTLLATEEIFFISQGQTSSGRPESISIAEIARFPLVLPCHPHAERALLEAALLQSGHKVNIFAELDSIPSIIDAVEAGMGGAILPWSAIYRHQGRLRVRGLAEPITREIHICRSEDMPPSSAAAAAWKIVKSVVSELVQTNSWKNLRVP